MTRFNLRILWGVLLVAAVCFYKTSRDPYSYYFHTALDTIHERGLKPIGREKLFGAAISGMAQAHDPHSSFISPAESKRYLNVLDQHLSGIGVRVEKDSASGEIIVLDTIIGTPHPAHDAGMRSGDRIIAIRGEPVTDKSLDAVVSLIRGKRGAPVSITVIHEGETTPETLEVLRREISIDSVLGDVREEDGSWNYALSSNPRIGYFQLTDFGDRTASELNEAWARQQAKGNLEAAVIDVRDNAGGYLTTAGEICDLFLDEGTIVTTRGRGGRVQEIYTATQPDTLGKLPLVVLINGESASASEIFAACMQDHARATIVGTRSFGKGSVQQMIPFADGGLLKLTTATYHRPSGENIHRHRGSNEKDKWGVQPDSGMEVTLDKAANNKRRSARTKRKAFRPKRGGLLKGPDLETTDPQLGKAIEYLEGVLEAK